MFFYLLSLAYFVLTIFIVQILIYNVTLPNVALTSYSIFWVLFMVYVTYASLKFSKEACNQKVFGRYEDLFKTLLYLSMIGIVTLFVRDVILMGEINFEFYLKGFFSFFITSMLISLSYFLEMSFYKYRPIWSVVLLGTILLSPLLVESEAFLLDIRLKSILDLWNVIVPYRSVEYLRQFAMFEGWTSIEIAIVSIIHLLIYWFVITSFCLYIRQFQAKWKFKEIKPGGVIL